MQMENSAVYQNILLRVQDFDAGARVASVSRRDADDSVLVALETNTDSPGLLKSLREAWPLASISLVKNLMNGRSQTQVLLPNERDQQELAMGLARASAWQRPLRLVANGLVALLVAACVQRVLEITSAQVI